MSHPVQGNSFSNARVDLCSQEDSKDLIFNSLMCRAREAIEEKSPETKPLLGRVSVWGGFKVFAGFFARVWSAIPPLFSSEKEGKKGVFPLQAVVREEVKAGSDPLRASEETMGEKSPLMQTLAKPYLGREILHFDAGKNKVFYQKKEGENTVTVEETPEQYWKGDGRKDGKGPITRVCLAKIAGGDQDEQVEAWKLLLQLESTGVVGTRHKIFLGNPQGNYDFTTNILSRILWEGEGNTGIPQQAKEHIAENLINIEGCDTSLSPKGSLGVFGESENHLLMIGSSRYLKNRWMQKHGAEFSRQYPQYDNKQNGQEEHVISMLRGIHKGGAFEFNARPYLAYTLTPLHNLYDYGSDEVRAEAKKALDYLYYSYALGSLWEEESTDGLAAPVEGNKGKLWVQEYPPFQRRKDKAKAKGLSDSYTRAFMIPLLAKEGVTYQENGELKEGTAGEGAHAFLASLSSYRLPAGVVELVRGEELEEEQKFVQMGHGKEGCPEIYYRDKNYLLSAGGSYRPPSLLNPDLQIVVRPIALFTRGKKKQLTEGQRDLSIDDVIHLKGRGDNYKDWNNTGVYKNFACSRGGVHIPEEMNLIETQSNWKLYQPAEGVRAAVYTKEEPVTFPFSLIFPPKKTSLLVVGDDELSLESLAGQEEKSLKKCCTLPSGEIVHYDLDSPKDRYVITAVNAVEADRDFTTWPLIRLGGN